MKGLLVYLSSAKLLIAGLLLAVAGGVVAGVIATQSGSDGATPRGPTTNDSAETPSSTPGRETAGRDPISNASPQLLIGDLRKLLDKDDIKPIYDPSFVSAGEAKLLGEDHVMGVAINGDVRAYPIGVLRFREMVNDVVGGVPLLVTW